MEHKFWHSRWEQNSIAFHLSQPNPLLTENLNRLSLETGDRVFVPLCGKTVDIPWLLSQQIRIVGAELSQLAVEQLFSEMKVTPTITKIREGIALFSSENIDIFVGDIFDLTQEQLGTVHAIYDRAALVALPEKTRRQYARHLSQITQLAPQLLITYEYDQDAVEGPPFSISPLEVHSLYKESYAISEVFRASIAGGMKGKCEAQEILWHLKPKR